MYSGLFLFISEGLYLFDYMSHAATPELGADRKRKREIVGDTGGTTRERQMEDLGREKITQRRDEKWQR